MDECTGSSSSNISSESIDIVLTEEASPDSSMSVMQPPTRKWIEKKKFADSWLSDPSFMPWLAKCEGNPYVAKCLACNKMLQAGRSELRRHMASTNHRRSMHRLSSYRAGMEAGGTTSSNGYLVQKAELRYVLDIVHHSRSFNSYEHYVPMLHAAHPDCNCPSLRKMHFKRSKISAIIKNVLSKTITERTTRILKQKLFTILIDESTDIAGVKALCILVRYVHEANIHTYLLDYVKVKDAKAEGLYKYLEYSLQKYELSVKNIIGISTDNASVMFGKKKSVIALLLKENPNVAVFPCICHNMHLLASNACKCLPRNLEKLLHKLYTHLSRSPKRQGQLEEIQTEMELAKHKMIQPSKTRWLALSECVRRVLEQWNALYKFFDMQVTGTSESETESDSMSQSQTESELSDASDKAQSKKTCLEIVTALKCPYTKAYLHFIDFTLNIITKYNRINRTSEVLVHNLLEYCNKFLKEIGQNFINQVIIAETQNLHEIDPFNSEDLLPLESMYIGGKAKSTLDEIKKQARDNHEQEKITQFLQNCQKFYQTAYKQAIKRFPFNDNFIKALDFLKPSVALDITKHTGQIDSISNKFVSKFDVAICTDEWHDLGFLTIRDKDKKEYFLGLEIVQFWQNINEMREPDGTRPFQNISNLALACLSLSHSNAEIERFFSLVTEMKTSNRNHLQPQMIAAIGRIRLEFQNTIVRHNVTIML